MPPDKKVIFVVGAASYQGFSLVRAIINEGDRSEFAVRALVSDASSGAAHWMRNNGVDLRVVNGSDELELEHAFEGAYGLFGTIFMNFGENPEQELQMARNTANAARKTGLKHVIWSTLEDTRKHLDKDPKAPTLLGKYKVPHFDVKSEADQFFVEASLPTTFLLTSFPWQNFVNLGMGPKKRQDGKLAIVLPISENSRLACIASEDIGKCALGIFKAPQFYINRRVGLVGEILTMPLMAAKMSTALDEEIAFRQISRDDYSTSGFHFKHPMLAAELANMLHFYQDCEEDVLANRSLEESRQLNPDLMNFDQWLATHRRSIPV